MGREITELECPDQVMVQMGLILDINWFGYKLIWILIGLIWYIVYIWILIDWDINPLVIHLDPLITDLKQLDLNVFKSTGNCYKSAGFKSIDSRCEHMDLNRFESVVNK